MLGWKSVQPNQKTRVDLMGASWVPARGAVGSEAGEGIPGGTGFGVGEREGIVGGLGGKCQDLLIYLAVVGDTGRLGSVKDNENGGIVNQVVDDRFFVEDAVGVGNGGGGKFDAEDEFFDIEAVIADGFGDDAGVVAGIIGKVGIIVASELFF